MRSLARRLQALMLTLIFLGGGTSLPSIDVLMFHLHGEKSQTTAHVENASGCGTHAGHCGIGCPASAANALGTQGIIPVLDTATPSCTPRSLADVTLLNVRGLGFYSRAPPIPLN